MSELNSVASDIAIERLLFLGYLITEPNTVPAVRMFESRAESYFGTNIMSIGVMLSISEVLVKYDLFQDFGSCFENSTFPTYTDWKRIVTEIRSKLVIERDTWS